MKIVCAIEWYVVWGSKRGTCNVYSTQENNMLIYDIFHDFHWFSETIDNNNK